MFAQTKLALFGLLAASTIGSVTASPLLSTTTTNNQLDTRQISQQDLWDLFICYPVLDTSEVDVCRCRPYWEYNRANRKLEHDRIWPLGTGVRHTSFL